MDNYTGRGRFKRAQIVRQDVREDVQQPVRQNVRQLRRVPSIAIDDLAGNWIAEVREAGGGLTLGPKDGVVAMPDKASQAEQGQQVEPSSGGGFVKELIGAGESPEEEEVVEAVGNVERAVREFVQGISAVLRRDHDG